MAPTPTTIMINAIIKAMIMPIMLTTRLLK
ncbi:MAG: hypothetical protein ACI9YH_002265 [Colwellia sp.]